MSAETDISRIQDEDLLRKMWQDTEDFGRKKEIRAHMYKVRETRLKDFYNSSEISQESQKTSTEKTTSTANTNLKKNFVNNQKTNMNTTHADNLADDSFLSYKSKEIRDSESPTRDVGYKSLGKLQDQGWTITSTNERSTDGKTESTSIKANTAGSQAINGGRIDFEAQHGEKASVFQDGDDKNYVKSAETQSNSLLRQEACGGDENSQFKTSTTKSSSSSRYISESKSASGNLEQVPLNAVTRDQNVSEQNSTKIYTRNAPDDVRSHPSYVEGKTKVTQETKTLSDGSTVTTTRYETKIGNSTQTAVTKNYSNVASSKSEQKFSSSSSSSQSHRQSSSNTTQDLKRTSKDTQKAIEYHIEPVGIVTSDRRSSTTSETTSRKNKNNRDEVDYVEFIVEPIVKTKNDNHYSTKTQTSIKVTRDSNQNTRDAKTPVDLATQPEKTIEVNINSKNSQRNEDTQCSSKTEKFSTEQTSNIVRETKHVDTQSDFDTQKSYTTQPVLSETVTTDKTTTIITESQLPRQVSDNKYSTTLLTNVNQKQDIRDLKKVTTDSFITTERKHEEDIQENTQIRESSKPKMTRFPSPDKELPTKAAKPLPEPYVQPERRQPIKSPKSELDQNHKPTEGMYDTTYRSEFTTKKISVEQRASHDAFARSLRAVTPERVRSSVSPDKVRCPNRSTPERKFERGRSPKKNTDRFSSTETITYTTRGGDPPRKSPTRYTNGYTTSYNTDTITKKNKTHTDTYGSNTSRKNKPRDYSPSENITTEYEDRRNISETTTNLGSTVTVTDKKTTNTETSRPSSLEFSKKTKKVTERSPTSPLDELVRSPIRESPRKSQSPTKDVNFSSNERPKLIRTDTYEERVKQILGITGETKEKRRSSLERSTLTKKSSFRETATRSSSHHEFNKSPSKEVPTSRKSPGRKSPAKDQPKVSEYPSQLRKSPVKEPFVPYSSKKSPPKEITKISEFPSQVRRSPERQPLEKYPDRKSPAKESPKISEFPSQRRKSPEKLLVETYPKSHSPTKTTIGISEFPSQINRLQERQSVEKEMLETNQIRISPEKQPYHENKLESPAEIRKSPKREPCPERSSPVKETPKTAEFPAQTKKSLPKQPVEPFVKESTKVCEFLSQVRKNAEEELLEPYSEKKQPAGPVLEKCVFPTEDSKVSEFPPQITKSPEKEPDFKKQQPEKSKLSITEFPSQIIKSRERQPLEPLPKKQVPVSDTPKISEFPAQIRKSPVKEPLEPYPEKKPSEKKPPSITEFPVQIRKSPERQLLKTLQEKSTEEELNLERSHAVLKSDNKTLKIRKTKVSKKIKTDSESSTGEETDAENIREENITETAIHTLENKIPVEEPLILKDFFNNLCREDEVVTVDKKKATKNLIDSEIIQSQIEKQVVHSGAKTKVAPKKKFPVESTKIEISILPKPTEKSKKNTETGKNPTISSKTPKKPTEATTRPIEKRPSDVSIKKPQESPKKPVSKTDIHLFTKSDSSTSLTKVTAPKKIGPKASGPVKMPSKKNIIETTTTTTKKITTKQISPQTAKPSTIPKKNHEIYKTTKTKFIEETVCVDECCKTEKPHKYTTVKKTFKPTEKITLSDVENIENVREDKSIHIRSNRVYDTVNKKKTSVTNTKTVLVNRDLNKTKSKQTTPTNKVPSKTDIPSKNSKSTTAESKYSTTTLRKISTKVDNKPQKHSVTTNINLPSKTFTPKMPNLTSKIVTTNKTINTVEEQNGYSSSDTEDESITENANDSFVNITNQQFSTSITDTTFKPLPKESDLTTTKETGQKTHKATKTVFMTDQQGKQFQVVVDLKRSKSSREPTPDRLCPRPMTSDEEDEELPRYPDQISEPDDGSFKRKPKRLSDIPILETEDTKDFTRITDVSDSQINKISEVDKVEETDESLLSVTKKVQKFLSTADKLTKPSTKPKTTKVKRPEFEVTEDLKSDECLLSVSDKVSKFITTAEQLVSPQIVSDRPKTPVCKNYGTEAVNMPKTVEKVPAPKGKKIDFIHVDEDSKEDECLLSVSDKVTKFISTAEKLLTTNSVKPVSPTKIDTKSKEPKTDRKSPGKDVLKGGSPTRDFTNECVTIETEEHLFLRKSPSLSPERRRSPSPNKSADQKPSGEYPSILKTNPREAKSTPSNDVTELTPKSARKTSLEDIKIESSRRSSQEDTKSVLSTTSRLRSTESIKKAKALFENIAKDQEKPKQRDILTRPSVFEARKNQTNKNVNLVNKKLDFTEKEDSFTSAATLNTKSLRSSPEKSPERIFETSKFSENVYNGLSSPKRSKSPEKYNERPKSTEKIEITRFRPSSPDKIPDISTTQPRSRESSPGEVPHYMKPLDRSLRLHSPHRDSVPQALSQNSQPSEEINVCQTKFGVTLKRTDSGRVIKASETAGAVSERRKSSVTLEKRVTEEEIEEIFELDVLEELIEKVIGYDLRRKIRAQIRLVKKLISEGSLEEYVIQRKREHDQTFIRKQSKGNFTPQKSSTTPKTARQSEISKDTEYTSSYMRNTSPDRKTIDNKLYQHKDLVDMTEKIQQSTEYQSSYTRKSSTDYATTRTTTRKSVSPTKERLGLLKESVKSSPTKERASPLRNGHKLRSKSPSPSKEWIDSCNRRDSKTKVSKFSETTPYGKTTTIKTTEKLPNGYKTSTTKTTESKIFNSHNKSSSVILEPKPSQDEIPEWIKSRNLRKTNETNSPALNRKVSSTSTTTRKTTTSRKSPLKEVKGTDIITSSYGVGPTDENGAPLFGLRALRAKNKNVETKVQGTVIQSEFYSKNGQEPIGQVSVTKYSTDPRDLEQNGVFHEDSAVSSVTTTQKFGYEDTPSLKSLTDSRKEICDSNEEIISNKTSRINRRGSVKALSQKFIDNAVESLKNERQTNYPKAGLILRTSSFKSSGDEHSSSRETSSVERDIEDISVTTRTSSSRTGETFLTNKSKITGVQDVITRMKNEEYQEGDSAEDVKARGLLNKFLGAQVMLSGMESHISSKAKTSVTTSPSGTVKKSTTVTTTVTEGGKPTITTRVFQHPVTEQELETVWEEQTLKLLLEQSSDYEERRFIRVRLRQLMAEQEACTALVDQATKGESTPPTPTTPTATGIEEQVETTKEVKKEGDITTTKVTTKVTTQQQIKSTKPLSPFAKFKQLDKQNSINKPSSPSTPSTPGSGGPIFKFTDPALTQSASTIKDRLLHWCRMKTKEYENIQLNNFSSSWADGLAFCALIHHFLPDEFDYSALTSKDRRHNFELAFKIADEKADIAPLLDVEDMLETTRPDWKCVFTYVQSIYRRFKDED